MMLNATEQRIVECVEKYGWFAMSVSPAADSDDPDEWFTYTIGLQKTYGWPEIICFGLGGNVAHGVLSDAIAECRENGFRPIAGLELHDTLADHTAKLVKNANIPFNYFGSANWFAMHAGMSDPPEQLQLLWPDRSGYFPDDERCDPEVRQLQTPVNTG